MILLGHDQAVAEWVGRINGKPFHPPFTAIGSIDRAGTLTGGFVFTGFNGDAIEMSLAGSGVVERGMWRAVLVYVFEQLGCARLQVHTRRTNKVVRRQATRLGLHFEGVARRLYGDADGLCYSLIRDDLPAFRARWKL